MEQAWAGAFQYPREEPPSCFVTLIACSSTRSPRSPIRCTPISSGQDGGWAKGPQPDGIHEFGYLLDPEPLGGMGSTPAPDPKLYATYDGAMGGPNGPAMGTETGLAGKIQDVLS
jgi:hypothetical protein